MTAPRPTLKTINDLADAGLLAPESTEHVARVSERYAMAIPPAMASLIDPFDADDPIARQFIPDVRELDRHPSEHSDPIGDDARSPVFGIVHRYSDRVLLKLTSVCPVYCRFCFRREMVGPGKTPALSNAKFSAAVSYIRAHSEIWEVILTGGDPFVLSPRRIAEVTTALSKIPHIKVLRWHTRVPAVAPELVSNALIDALQSSTKTVYVSLHANHPREMTAIARAACARIIDAGIAMVSQTVLLKGVNDDAATLEALMRAFVETRVKPYYLHHGDLAPGTAHFRTTIAHGQALMCALRARLSGLAIPTYVIDIPGAHGKVPIGPDYLSKSPASPAYTVRDSQGQKHTYEDCCVGPVQHPSKDV